MTKKKLRRRLPPPISPEGDILLAVFLREGKKYWFTPTALCHATIAAILEKMWRDG